MMQDTGKGCPGINGLTCILGIYELFRRAEGLLKPKQKNCDRCRHYDWYYGLCNRWHCETGAEETCDSFESVMRKQRQRND